MISSKRYTVRFADGTEAEDQFSRLAPARRCIRDARKPGAVFKFERGGYLQIWPKACPVTGADRKISSRRLTIDEITALVRELDDETLDRLIPEANAEDRRRFDARCEARKVH